MDCEICKAVIHDKDTAVNVEVGQGIRKPPGMAWYTPRAHPQCVRHPERLGHPADFDKWTQGMIRHIDDRVDRTEQAIQRIEDALLELPEDMMPQFRDQMGQLKG